MKPVILLIGVGHLGGALLELLARDDLPGRIVACDLPGSEGERRVNLARLGAASHVSPPEIEFHALDVTDIGALGSTLEQYTPDLIVSAVSRQTWWLVELLPPEPRARLSQARFGAWLPVHFTLTYELMKGLKACEYDGIVLTAPFPDVVNCVLGKLGLAPLCGVGTIDENVTKVRELAAARLAVPAREIDVRMVAHHALQSAVFAESRVRGEIPPYYLRVGHEGRDVTEEVGADDLLLSPCPLPGGPAWSWFTAGSTIGLLKGLFRESSRVIHVPAPGGLPGGYPVTFEGQEMAPVELDDLTREEAIAINERSHPFDGIEQIEENGTVVFTDTTAGILREELGYDCPQLAPGEAGERATELITRFRDYAARHGVTL